MFLLQKAFKKSKRLSDTDETPQTRPKVENVPPRSTIFDPTRSLRADALPIGTLSEPEVFSPVMDALSAEASRRVDPMNRPLSAAALADKLAAHLDATNQTSPTNIPGIGRFSRPPSPTVIGETPMDSALMSGQPDVTHSILSACNDLPPLPDALTIVHNPKYMPTDPSPFTSPVTSYFPRKQIDVPDNTLRLGGLLKMAVDGREFMARVTEIQPANRTDGPSGRYNYRPPRLRVEPTLSSTKAWWADDDDPMLPVQKWVNTCAKPNQPSDKVTPGPERTLSDATTKPGITLAKGAGIRKDGLVQSWIYPPKDTALLERPALNHSSKLYSPPTDSEILQLLGAKDVYHEKEPQTGQVPPIRVSLKVSQWRHTTINPEKTYQCGGVLGKGSFAKVTFCYASAGSWLMFLKKVYLVLRTQDKRQFAMKIHDFRHPMLPRTARSLLKELRVQQSIAGRPFLSGMMDIWYSSADFLHVTTVSTKAIGTALTQPPNQEYCSGGNLLSYVGKLSKKQMLLVIAEVVSDGRRISVSGTFDF